ncbi:MAG: LysR family transcriptional regulator [Synergistaceae bacterium]|jgi:DNA-binding transcriptional LysR family regulator|nr:LysR family transcriptional regulator [Synergistaceae bacterium]
MDFIKLVYFVQVAKDGNITKAARSLNMTQQSLSRAIQTLEVELSAKLFDRGPGGVVLTMHGRYLYNSCNPLVEQYYMTEKEILNHFNGQDNDIAYCSAPGVWRSISPDILIDFQKDYPDLTLKGLEAPDLQCERNVIDGVCKIGCTLSPQSDELTFQFIKSEQIFLFVHYDNPLSRLDAVDFSDLRKEKFACFTSDFRMRQMVIDKCKEAGYYPDIVFESADVSLLTQVVFSNRGIFMCVEHVVETVKNKNLRFVPFKDESFRWKIGFVHKKSILPDKPYRRFMNFVIEHCGQKRD